MRYLEVSVGSNYNHVKFFTGISKIIYVSNLVFRDAYAILLPWKRLFCIPSLSFML
jgi:hypothetical protein